MESVPESKVAGIPHGFNLDRFRTDDKERLNRIRREYSLDSGRPVITVISRLLELKGIEYIIRAFKSLLDEYPDAILLMLNATGPHRDKIIKELESIPASNYRLVEFEKDIPAIYAITDVYVHVPIDASCEAFGQTYIESMASSTPGVFTKSGIGGSILKNEENCLVVPYRDSDAIQMAIKRLIGNSDLVKLIAKGGEETSRGFNIRSQADKLLALYA
jgi:glycosyltransferase involved in cell wall biosynthesis